MMTDCCGGGGMMMVGMGLFWLVVLSAMVVGLIFLVRALSDRGSSRSRPLELLEERFARGEIEREEFEEHRGALERW